MCFGLLQQGMRDDECHVLVVLAYRVPSLTPSRALGHCRSVMSLTHLVGRMNVTDPVHCSRYSDDVRRGQLRNVQPGAGHGEHHVHRRWRPHQPVQHRRRKRRL